jgi:magnesium transporter
MARFHKNQSMKIGKSPGTLTFIGRKKMDQPRFRVISYNKDVYNEREYKECSEFLKPLNEDFVHWINIDGLHDVEVISEICNFFKLSPLVQEDIVNTDQRPKFVEGIDHLVVILKHLSYNQNKDTISCDQISLILGKGYIISFQEKIRNIFDPIRERLSQNVGKLRSCGPDYLFYRIIDALADNYMVCIGTIGDLIEKNEDLILKKINKQFINEIFRLKTEVNFLRKNIRPAKEVTKLLKNIETDLINETTWPFFDHLDDMLTNILESVELYFSMLNDQLNIYNTSINNHTNSVIKILTIFTALFIPLTFIVGVYGTNFDNLPELHLRYGYFAMWGVMIVITILLLFYFRRKKWF